jgi:hypothetical protein
MRNKKKGSLSLSINAIVVLILAITMLGLGLTFMTNIFGKSTEEFEDVGGAIKKQLIDKMKSGTKIVDISAPKIDLKPGDSRQIFIAFRNSGDVEQKFTINNDPVESVVSSFKLHDENNRCYLTSGESDENGDNVYLEFKQSATTVLSGAVMVLPINIKATSDAGIDTCFFELAIDYGEEPVERKVVPITVDITNS